MSHNLLSMRDVSRRLERVLDVATSERTTRTELVETEDGSAQLGWVLFEREQMLTAVNDLRAEHGKAPVTLSQVIAAETSASGHVDYVFKFALYCAELALDA